MRTGAKKPEKALQGPAATIVVRLAVLRSDIDNFLAAMRVPQFGEVELDDVIAMRNEMCRVVDDLDKAYDELRGAR
jgi:hypothetical protein